MATYTELKLLLETFHEAINNIADIPLSPFPRSPDTHKVLQDALCSLAIAREETRNMTDERHFFAPNEIVLALKENPRRQEPKKTDDRSPRPSNDNDNAVINEIERYFDLIN